MRISDWSSDVCSSGLPHARCPDSRPRSPPPSRQRADRRGARVLRGPTATILRMEGLAQASPNGSRSGGEAQEGNRLRRGQDDRHAVLRLEDFTVEDDVRPRSEEHTSELQSLMSLSYAAFCLKKKTHQDT